MKFTDFFSIIEPLALIKMLPRPHITILCHLLVLLINKCRGPFFLPHQNQAQSFRLCFKGPKHTRPSGLRQQKTRINGIGPSIKPKTQAGPLNPKLTCLLQWYGAHQNSPKREGKPSLEQSKRRGKITPSPPPRDVLSFLLFSMELKMKKGHFPNDKYGSPGIIIAREGWFFSLPSSYGRTSTKTSAATPAMIGEMMGKTKQGLMRSRKLPWPPKLPPLKSNDHRSPALRWSLFILNMELRKNGLEVGGLIY
jgi:hypothetical protein